MQEAGSLGNLGVWDGLVRQFSTVCVVATFRDQPGFLRVAAFLVVRRSWSGHVLTTKVEKMELKHEAFACQVT